MANWQFIHVNNTVVKKLTYTARRRDTIVLTPANEQTNPVRGRLCIYMIRQDVDGVDNRL